MSRFNNSKIALCFNSKPMEPSFVFPSIPDFCLPAFIKEMPLGIAICSIYLLGVLVIASIGFYLIRNRFIHVRRYGYSVREPNTEEQQSNAKKLRRMLRSRQDTQMQEIPVLNGDKS